MKFHQILEATYHGQTDTTCQSCGNRFDYDKVSEDRFFKDFAYCPNCGKPVARKYQNRVVEAKYAGHKDEQWLHDAKLIADGNLKRNAVGRPGEVEYWENYKEWCEDNRNILQKLYDQIKDDRDHFLSVVTKMPELRDRAKTVKIWTDALRQRKAEVWSGNIDQHDYPLYWELIDNDNPAYHDYTIMVSNTMIDILGGLRDERS